MPTNETLQEAKKLRKVADSLDKLANTTTAATARQLRQPVMHPRLGRRDKLKTGARAHERDLDPLPEEDPRNDPHMSLLAQTS
jgi:hypothetical protein